MLTAYESNYLKLVTIYFKGTNINKAQGPDGIGGRVLRHCAEQLGSVFAHLFRLSLQSGQIPSLWKFSHVIPIPKKPKSIQPNDFRPVALTSLVMKTLEKIIKRFLVEATESLLDPLQFAYRAGRGVDDAKLFILNSIYKHLEKPKTHVKIIFADFSSAFNTVQPHMLAQKLIDKFKMSHQLVRWILNFLTDRRQRVIVNGNSSDVIITNTGSPQGCCLSPFLYILYTDDCRSSRDNCHFVKFSDDAAILSMLTASESSNKDSLSDFVLWCDNNFLELNAFKTKEMSIDFRKNKEDVENNLIHNEPVELVETYKYLGSTFDNNLKWDVNTDQIFKRCQQRMYLLRKLKSFDVNPVILSRFYQSFIESILTFSFICWFQNLQIQDRNCLNSIVNISSKIIGIKQRDLNSFYQQQLIRKLESIVSIEDHALINEFNLLKSGRRYRMPCCKTNRHLKSFVPSAVKAFNSNT